MADGLPINFDVPGEGAVASYDFYDFAEGTGMKLFYGAVAGTSYATKFLTTNQVYSHGVDIGVSGIAVNADFTKVIDYDFDLSSFNAPKVVRGTGIVQISGHVAHTGGTTEAYFIVKLRKWDGAAETEIGSGTGVTRNTSDPTWVEPIAVSCTLTSFGIGDVLRLTVEGWVKHETAGTASLYLGVDPVNRDGTYIIPSTDVPTSTTQLKTWVPFRIQP